MSKVKRVLIGSPQPNAKPHIPINKTVEVLAKELDAEIKYLPPLPLKTKDGDELDSYFDESKIIKGDWTVNSRLIVRATMRARPASRIPQWRAVKNLKPTASVIVPGLRQEIEQLPRMGTHLRLVVSPGALTIPTYKDSDTGSAGAMEHFYGVVLVEYTENDFRVYNIQFFEDNSAYHLGVQYFPNGKKRKLTKDELRRVDGDDHMDERDPLCERALDDIHKIVPASVKVSHDTFNGSSINHHEMDNLITQAQKSRNGTDDLERELEITVKKLEDEEKKFDKVIVVGANHNDFLARFNQSGRWLTDRKNFLPGIITSVAQFFGVNPIKFALTHYKYFLGELENYMKAVKENRLANFKLSSQPALVKTEILDQGQSYQFGGIELGDHGDKGANGAKGNPKKAEQHLGFCVVGHNHIPWLKGRSGGGGTTSIMDPDYVKGKGSSWGQGCVFVACPKGYDLGCLQLVHIVNGKWKPQ